jgi:hypothetical protein
VKRLKSGLFWLIFITLNFAVFAVAGEVLLHVAGYRDAFFRPNYKIDGITTPSLFTFDPVTGYAPIPNIRDRQRGISTDEFGNRITARPFDKGKQSIVLVGDSSVFGWGVRDEQTFAYKLAKDPRFSEYNIVDTGVPSYSLGHIAAVIKDKAARYNPALVVVAVLWPWKAFDFAGEYGSSEGWKAIDFDFYKKIYPVRTSYTEPPDAGWSDFRLPVFFKDLYYRLLYSRQIRENMMRPGVRDFNLPKEQEIQYASEHVAVLKEAVSHLPPNTKVLFYVHPYQYTIFRDEYKHLGEVGYQVLLTGLGTPDLKPRIRAAYAGEEFYIDGAHLTPTGHDMFEKLLGDMIATKLK